MEGVKSFLDVEALRSGPTTTMPYPHLYIEDINNFVPVVIHALEGGEAPLVGTYKGITKVVKGISKTALNVDKLLRVTGLTFVVSSTESYALNTVLDYLEVAEKWT